MKERADVIRNIIHRDDESSYLGQLKLMNTR